MDRTPQMSARWRGKLLVALVILALLSLAFLVHGATAVHAWFETQDSLAHWREKQQSVPGDQATVGYDSPGRRILRLEEDAQRSVERLLLSVGMLLFNGTLIVLGFRKYRSG